MSYPVSLRRHPDGDEVIMTVVIPPHLWCEQVARVSKGGMTLQARSAAETLHFDDPQDIGAALDPPPGECQRCGGSGKIWAGQMAEHETPCPDCTGEGT